MFTAYGIRSIKGDATYPYSGLSQHAYLTNKHKKHHFKNMRD